MDYFFRFISYVWVLGLAGCVFVVMFVLYEMAKAIAAPTPLEAEGEGLAGAKAAKNKEPGDPLHTH